MNNNLLQTLRAHIESHYPILYLSTYEEAEADKLIAALRDDRRMLEWNMAQGMVDYQTRQPLAPWCDLATALENWQLQELENHYLIIRDAHLGMRDQPRAIAGLKNLMHKALEDETAAVTVFMISSQPYIPAELEKLITLFELPLPDEMTIRELLGAYARGYEFALNADDQARLATAFQGLTRHEIGQLINRSYQRSGKIDGDDLDLIQTEKVHIIRKSGILDMPTTTERIEDIGGLHQLKPWLQQKAKVLNNWPSARDFGVAAPKGVMIVGMPGCGKSLTAKAAAALFQLPILKLDMGSLMGKYVGESERNMRHALQVAEAISPCLLWVDEVEKAFVGVGQGGTGSEVTTRLFGYFLTWMQEKTKQVFVIATANDISNLPPELLRKGRFDEIFYVDFPNLEERREIFALHLNKRGKNTPNINLDQLAAKTEGYSGADIEAIILEATEHAFVDHKAALDTARLLKVIESTYPLSEVMKDKVKESKERFSQMKIKKAS